MNWGNIFRSKADGEPEVTRTLLVGSVAAVVIMPIIFESLDMYHNGWHFDAAVWCVAYPGGIVALIAGGVIAAAKKEKDLAVARATDATSAAATAGAQA
jgi:hypothetical protein